MDGLSDQTCLRHEGGVVLAQADGHHPPLEVVGAELEGAVQEVPQVAQEL